MKGAVVPSARSLRRRVPAGVAARLLGLVACGLLLAAALASLSAHAQVPAAPEIADRALASPSGAVARVASMSPDAGAAPPAGLAVAAVAAGAAVEAPAPVAASAASAAPADPVTWNATALPASRQVLAMLRSPTEHARVDGSYGGGYGDAARARSQARVAARIAAAHGFALVTQWPMPALGMDCMVLALPPGTSVAAGIAALQSHAEVVWAQPMNEFEAQGRAETGHVDARPGHADPLYALQPAAAQWHLDELHAVATGRRVRVALLDSGVDLAHPDLAQAVEAAEDFVGTAAGAAGPAEQHGTAVAGLVAARADNGIGIVGIAPDARLLALRACWEATPRQTLCNSLSLAKALSFAIEHHAEIINMSLSGPADPLLARLIDAALARRQQVVAAVDARASGGGFPADHPGVIAVADALAPPTPGLPGAWTAPARDLPATAPGGGWRMVSGSSFAAGQVSGLLAVLAQARAEARERPVLALASSSVGSEHAPPLVRLPGGGIDACASLLRAAGILPDAASGCRALVASSAGSEHAPPLVRLPGGGIDACASLLRAAGILPDAASGCRALVASSAGAGNGAAGAGSSTAGTGSNMAGTGSGMAGGSGIAAGVGAAAAAPHP
jgi:hypothetical protein